MGNINSCEQTYDIKSPKKEINSINSRIFQNKISHNNKINLNGSKKIVKLQKHH